MSNVKSFNVNGINTSINIVNETEDGFMSSHDYIKLVDISSGVNLNASTSEDIIYPYEILSISDNPEYIDVKTDSNANLLESINYDGHKTFYTDVTIVGNLYNSTINALNCSISDLALDVIQSISELATKVYSVQNELSFLNFAIDTSIGVLRICNKMYKLIDYEGNASFDEYVDVSLFVSSITSVDSSEYQSVIIDSEDKILYGVYVDGTETDIDLYSVTIPNPSTGKEVTITSILNLLK